MTDIKLTILRDIQKRLGRIEASLAGTMSYRGYDTRVEYESNDAIFFGMVADIDDVVTFHADTVAGLRGAFCEAVDDYIETCAEIGKEPCAP